MPTSYFNGHKSIWVCLFTIIALGASLRLIGINWGIPSDQLPFRPFHPDEVWVMGNLQQINISNLDFNPETAHAEGTLSYFIWTSIIYICKLVGIIKYMPNELASYAGDYGHTILIGRLLTAFIDIISIIFIFLIVKNITKNNFYALIGAFIFAIIPYELIHAHFMRGHIIANFFEILVIYCSFKISQKDRSSSLYAFAGFFSAMAMATRYQTVVVIIFPLLINFFNSRLIFHTRYSCFLQVFRSVFNKQILLLLFGFAVGLVIGLPYLLFDFESAKPHIQYLASYTAESEFSLLKLFDLSRVWVYLDYLIPYGTLPWLWVLFYFSLIYLIFRRQLYKYTIPLILFIGCYLYPMAKGYFASPIFIRAAIPLFPVFAILSALAIGDIYERIRTSRVKCLLMFTLLALITIPTILYDYAYVLAMRNDSRIQMYNYFKKRTRKTSLNVGLLPSGHDYFLTRPTLDLLPLKLTVNEDYLKNEISVSYLVISAFEPNDHTVAKSKIESLIKSNKFSLDRVFRSELKLFGFKFDYSNNPHDLQYPFPTLYVLRKLPQKSS